MNKLSIKSWYLLFPILLLAVSLRLFNLPERVIFDADQEFAATFAYEVLKIFPVRLIGQGLSVQSLFMGPLYFYFLVPFFAISRLHPIGGYIGSIALGLITISLYFWVFKSVFGTKAGLIAAYLRTILFFSVQTDLLMTPAFSSDLAVVLTWYCFYKYWHDKHFYLLPLSFLFGLYTSFHPILFPFYFILPVLFLLKRHFPPPKYLILSFLCFLLPLSPLLIFEYFHNFTEIKALFLIKNSGSSEIKTVSILIDYLKIIFIYPVRMLGISLPDKIVLVLAFIFYSLSSIFIARKISFWKQSFHRIFPLTTFIIFLLYYFILPVHVPDYYFSAVFTVIFIYFAGNISIMLKKKQFISAFFLLLLITLTNFVRLHQSFTSPFRASLKDKETVIRTIRRLSPDNNMKVYYDTDLGLHFGLGYLQRYYGMEANGGPGTPEYIIVIPSSRRKN